MVLSNTHRLALIAFSVLLVALTASAQESAIYTQCPTATALHPGFCEDATTPCNETSDPVCSAIGDGTCVRSEPGIECRHVVSGDGVVTMADDAQKELYIFSFAELPGEGALPNEGDEVVPGPAPNDPAYPGWVVEQGMLAANGPAPTIVVDEDDELYFTNTNVGMVIRPDLFDPHTIHWHGFPEAAPIFDGVPDASISINMMASLTYFYKANDAGTYMYHCHVEATEHMQMGMLGNLYVRPRQNRLPAQSLNGFAHTPWDENTQTGNRYAYNDGDGSTAYDVEVPIQIGSFDPDFHDASFNVQPLPFAGMKDRYFLLNGRGYPDTVNPSVLSTADPIDPAVEHPSQPINSLIEATVGQRILLRISNLNVTQFNTLGTNGMPMEVVALDARLLRDGAGNDLYYRTNSLTLGGGQSADVILTPATAGTYFLYTTNLHQLANDAENFGGMMTEIRVH
jgi:FtsP/CotA-like multicopper oxidase with cupredoxin domain